MKYETETDCLLRLIPLTCTQIRKALFGVEVGLPKRILQDLRAADLLVETVLYDLEKQFGLKLSLSSKLLIAKKNKELKS